MKRLSKLLLVMLLVAVPVLAWTTTTHAQRFKNTIEDDQVVHGSVYSSGRNISLKGVIYGDVFCMGQKVDIDAEVHGDIICAGMDIAITGKVHGDIRVAGQRSSIDAEVDKNVTVLSAQFSLDAGAKVGQDLTVHGDRPSIKGSVGRDLVVGAAGAVLNGSVGRNVTLQSGGATLKSGAQVRGDLTYTGSKPTLEGDAEVKGKTRQHDTGKSAGYTFNLNTYLFAVSSMSVLAALLVALAPRYFARTRAVARGNLLKAFFIGTVSCLLIPLTVLLLGITLVGIPLAVALLIAGLFVMLLSWPTISHALGAALFKSKQTPVMAAAAGGALIVTSYFLPWIGIVCLMITLLSGAGTVILDAWQQRRNPLNGGDANENENVLPASTIDPEVRNKLGKDNEASKPRKAKPKATRPKKT